MILGKANVTDRYKISNLRYEQNIVQNDWGNQLIFFAFPEQTTELKQRKYYIDSADNPYRHRVLIDDDYRDFDGAVGWKADAHFWAFPEKQLQTQAYTVLYAVNPYRSQIVEGNNVKQQGWEVHSVFWAYSTPGKLKCYQLF